MSFSSIIELSHYADGSASKWMVQMTEIHEKKIDYYS